MSRNKMNEFNASASIIAGGKSERFGFDKTMFLYKGKPLIQHISDIIRPIFNDISIIADDWEKFSFLDIPVYPDIPRNPKFGPLGGLYTALTYCKNQRCFIFACDMPNINPELIKYMISVSEGSDITIPSIGIHYQALHAIYSKNCIDPIERLMKAGEKKIQKFFHEMNIRKVTADEMGKFADIETVFKNINYPEDL